MSLADEGKLDPAVVAALYVDHGDQLRRFLYGVLGDATVVADVLQSTFAKAIERGHEAEPDSRKAWLFRVAYHEALALRRRHAAGRRATEKLAWLGSPEADRAEELLVRYETVAEVKAAIAQLPAELQQVVRLRIYEEKQFACIARELNIPLGTALGRMRTALAKLREKLRQHRD